MLELHKRNVDCTGSAGRVLMREWRARAITKALMVMKTKHEYRAAEVHPSIIPFNLPSVDDCEFKYLSDAIKRRELAGNGHYTQICNKWLERRLGVARALLTQSGTAALEMAAILCDLAPGDEVIMPSFTFVSTANAVVLRGAIPVFIDIRPDTLNIDEMKIEQAITPRTKAIFVTHYAGVPCEMDTINAIAAPRRLLVVEDAAQALMSTYKGIPAGRLGVIGCFSFHATKNVMCGEGGALIIDRQEFAERAEVVWEKGTNRHAFLKGGVDKYIWLDIGSSFVPSELTAAFLAAQLEKADVMTCDRITTWNAYHSMFEGLERRDIGVVRPTIPRDVTHNGHIYYLLLRDGAGRNAVIKALKGFGIETQSHFVPLHSSPAGRRFARTVGELQVTDDAASRLLRLPLWFGMGDASARVGDTVMRVLDR